MDPIAMNPIIIIGQDDEGSVVCAIADLPEEPGVVGIMLADTIRHVANAYCGAEESREKAEVILQIWELLKAEMTQPTGDGAKMVTECGQVLTAGLIFGERDEGDS